MTCLRCQSVMVWDQADDLDAGLRAGQYRCLSCGHRVTGKPVALVTEQPPRQKTKRGVP